ncbi:hypothetical protein [Sporomusa sp.]|uniref:hypothetical protein n=1 Tax=Sporomusa sp. TaxID=2078658 RepID=UPI002BE3AEE8|nr:hypothetical protein [Sporomusa sp.]HWR42802.1 hypothetical protein [Sporomusa sp.]
MQYKHYGVICLLGVALIFTGCAAPKSQPPANPPAQQQQAGQQATMEDPKPIIAQMNQAVDDIAAKSQANQLPQAKQSAGNLVVLNDRLVSHFSDTAFRDRLRQAVMTLHDEVSKPTPDKATVDSQVQTVRGLLKEAPGKIMTM